ncbi:MAG: MFS transporter [Acidobacteriota bacterium]
MPSAGTAAPIRTNWLTAASYGGMFVFGIVMAVIGALLPRLSIGLAQAGNLFLGLTFTMLVAMLCLGPLTDRFGKKPPLAMGALFVAAALAVMAASRAYGSLLAAVALLGVGGGALNGATNTLIADLHTDPRRKNAALNLLGVFYGFGALFLPFVIGSLVDRLGLGTILWLAAVPTAAVAALFFALSFPAPKRAQGLRIAEVARLARNPLVLLFGFLLFFQSGNEFLIGGYTSTYLARDLRLPLSTASYLLAAYWAAIMAARVLLSRLLLKAKGPGVVMVSGVGVAVGVCLLMLAHSTALAAAGTILIGCSFASIYPTVLGLAGAQFEESSGTVFGILFAIALAGGMLMPWTVGQIAEQTSLRAALGVSAFCGIMICVLQAVIARRIA